MDFQKETKVGTSSSDMIDTAESVNAERKRRSKATRCIMLKRNLKTLQRISSNVASECSRAINLLLLCETMKR